MLQEALKNVFKHAKASLIVIDLALTKDHIHLSTSDNGIGFKPLEVSGKCTAGQESKTRKSTLL
jgi:signal transduction histidine kinase